jgi:hypothetical protein
MKFSSWLDALKAGPSRRPIRRTEPRSPRRQSAGGKLLVEHLEDRTVPAFVGPVDYGVGASPQAVVSGDFNNDAILDLAVANYSDSTVSVLLGNANGTFQPAVNSDTDTAAGAGVGPRSLAVGDFDGDGHSDDIATVNNSDVSILLGNGDGTFLLNQILSLPAVTDPSYPEVGAIGQGPLSVTVGDLTGDGLLDLVVTGQSSFTTRHGPYSYYGYTYYTYQGHNNGHVNVLVGDGTGNFTPPAAEDVQRLAGSYPISAVLEELDSVPGLDLAVADYYGSTVRVLSGNNDGTFDAPVDYSTGWNPTSVLTGDVNGDGISDLVTANYYSASVLLGNGSAGVGNGTFQSPRTTSLASYPASLAVGDINDDGKLDIVTSSNFYTQTGDYYSGYSGFYTGQINVLLGYGDGTFASPTGHVLADGTYASGVAVGDFSGDGLPDVAVTNSDSDSGNVSVLINAGEWVLPARLSIADATAVTEGDSGTVAVTFTVTRSGNLDGEVSVNYATANGGALSGSDYVAKSGTLTFADGVATQTITILVNGDLTDEYDQGFYVNLSAATNANLTDSQGFGNILDNDPPPTITITNVSAKEGNGNGNGNGKNNNGTTTFHFIVTLSAASEKQVWVNFATANGTATTADNDYVAKSGTLSFSPGDTSETISVAVKGDKRKESNETFVVNLSAPTNATIALAQGIGTIQDDDTRGNG